MVNQAKEIKGFDYTFGSLKMITYLRTHENCTENETMGFMSVSTLPFVFYHWCEKNQPSQCKGYKHDTRSRRFQ